MATTPARPWRPCCPVWRACDAWAPGGWRDARRILNHRLDFHRADQEAAQPQREQVALPDEAGRRHAEIDAERAATEPKVFTRIHVHFKVTGRGLDPKRVENAIHLSADKYCSASIMLGKTATITHDFEIVESS